MRWSASGRIAADDIVIELDARDRETVPRASRGRTISMLVEIVSRNGSPRRSAAMVVHTRE
jgi:hypothetical protein